MAKAKRKRIRDVPILAFDGSQRPYFIKEGYLSEIAGMVPTIRGGYRRAPQWADHYDASGKNILGASVVGELDGVSQITVAVALTNNPSQYRVIAAGTAAGWGGPSTFGANQDVERTRFVYHRMGGNEYTLGWDPSADPHADDAYHCHLFLSKAYGAHAWPTGCAKMSHSGITATPETTGGHMSAGHCRIYLVFYGSPGTGGPDLGATDHTNKITAQTAGVFFVQNRNKVVLTDIPTSNFPDVSKVYIYRTRVVADAAQADIEPAYLCQTVNEGTTTASLELSDTALIKMPQLELGKYDFPTLEVASQFKDNLQLGEHLGYLACTGVKYDYRMYFGGYLDTEGVVVQDENWWAFSVDIPGKDKIVSWVSFRGICLVLCKNGLWRLRDESADPTYWYWEQMAALRGEHVSAVAIVSDVVMIVARGLGGEWNIWACDGINLNPVGDEVSVFLDGDTGIVSNDGMPMLIGASTSRNYVMNQQRKWGKNNADTDVRWAVGRDDDFQSGAPLLVGPNGVYYEGSAFSNDSSDYGATREYFLDIEERTEWEKIYVLATKVANDASVKVQGRVNGRSWVDMKTITVDTTSGGRYEVPVPPALRHGETFGVKLIATDADQFTIEGVIVQARPSATMT